MITEYYHLHWANVGFRQEEFKCSAQGQLDRNRAHPGN